MLLNFIFKQKRIKIYFISLFYTRISNRSREIIRFVTQQPYKIYYLATVENHNEFIEYFSLTQ